jgi:hypothetical protein
LIRGLEDRAVVRVVAVRVQADLNVDVVRVDRVRCNALRAPVVKLRVVRPVDERDPRDAVRGELVGAADVGAQVGEALSP